MKPTLRNFSIALLLFNGVAACFGGWMLMKYPDGSGLGMPLDLLKYSPFGNFLIPGIILFVVNGLLSLAVAWLTIQQTMHNEKLVMVQGGIMVGWIVIQMIMLQVINYLHVIFIATGTLLIVLGFMMSRRGIVT
jgi:hypothetical protein